MCTSMYELMAMQVLLYTIRIISGKYWTDWSTLVQSYLNGRENVDTSDTLTHKLYYVPMYIIKLINRTYSKFSNLREYLTDKNI
jgi:hypothetical protein